VARDRVVGILLGLFMMWLVFDQIWGAPAVVDMKKTFSSALRLLAQFAKEPLSKDVRTAIDKSFALRETINTTVNQGRALADGILLEFGPSRVQDLAFRDRIRAWQAELRTIFINRTVLWKYRMQLPGFELPVTLVSAQSEFDEQVANTLEGIADRFEAKASGSGQARLEDAFEHLENAVRTQTAADSQQGTQMQLDTLLKLSRNTEQLLTSLNRDI
jgi:multidrug resistance protein MdtO